MKRRKPYAEAFKHAAVTVVTAQEMGVTQVARDVDIRLDTLHRWLRAARSASTPPNDASTSNAERARLRREHEQVRMERGHAQTSARHLFADVTMTQTYAFVTTLANAYPVTRVCRVLGVARRG